MADKYERWNNWAPRYIADLKKDLGYEDFQAAAYPGNFAAESGYFNSLQELNPLVPGSKGGLGHAQHTGPRRRKLEAWLTKKGLKVDSYEGNYSYIIRELKGWEPGADYRNVAAMVKKAKTLDEAVYIVGKYYEGPLKLNLGPRTKAAHEALELYRKNPVAPTVWPTDKEMKMPEEKKVIVTEAKPAQPVAGSIVMQGVFGGIALALYTAVKSYDPALAWNAQPETFWISGIGGLLTALYTAYGRISSKAQPLTWTQAGADEVAAKKVIAEVPAEGPLEPPPAPATPVEGLHMGLQQVTGVLDLLGMFAPQLKVLSTIAHAVESQPNATLSLQAPRSGREGE